MFCIVAFVVLSILGIFSASNRQLAREAMDCVFRRVTLRPCNTGFDEKMKARILGTVITRSETAAVFLNKNFEVLSWVFFILLTASSIWSVRGVYLFYVTGSCEGLNSTAFCVFDPTGKNTQTSAVTQACVANKPHSLKDLTLKDVDLSLYPVVNPGAKDKIVFVGCYACDYTRKAYPAIQELLKKGNVAYYHLEYPLPGKERADNFLPRVTYVVYQQNPQAYWKLNDILFASDKDQIETPEFIQKTLDSLGLDGAKILASADDPKVVAAVKKQIQEVNKTKFYGTPTVFINGEPFVGPKPYRVYAISLRGLWYW